MRITTLKLLQIILIVHMTVVASAPAMDKEGVTVAVWDLENFVPADLAVADMGEMLSAKVIETFKESGKYVVVERERLLLILEELNIGASDMVSESTRLKIGRIVGARLMVFGSYTVIINTMQLDLRMVEVETGHILKATFKTTSSSNPIEWLKIARDAAEELL